LRVASENGCEPYVLTQLEASAPNPALEISSRRTEGVAPAGMIFTVESRGFAAARSFHDVHYTWTFDDPGEHTQLSSDYPWAPDANLAYGPVASHTFTKPGTYAVRVVATDGVIRAVREVDVTVLDPDVVFAGSDTVAISQNGDFTGAPAGATEVTSVPAALAAAGSNVRILFRAGEVFEQGLGKINAERLSVGAFGLGDPPVLHDQIVDNEDVTGESSVWGLFVQGDYDASDPFNSPSRGPGGVRVANKNHTTVHDCRFDGIVTAFRNGETENLVVSNVRAENWSDYGMLLGDGGWVSFHGVAFRQHPRAINGQGKGNITADHGPIRISRPTGPVSFHLIDFFSNVSWFNNSSVQNVIRWNTGGLEQAQDLVLDRARTEGGSVFGGQNNGGLAHRMRVVVDKFHHISSYSPASLLTLGHPGSTVRNAIVVIPDVAPLSSTGTRYAFSFEAGSASPAEGVYPKELYSCTIVDLRSPSNATNGSGSSTRDFQPYNGGSGQNCVTYAPRIGGGTTSDGPLDLSPRWTPRNPGRSVENEPFDPSYATPSESAAIFQPEGESPAIESALRTLNVAYDDFFGRRRGAKPSRGAVEP
ncbi:MAG: PKD domain-containing protein, partial [Myxococcota bacterium]